MNIAKSVQETREAEARRVLALSDSTATLLEVANLAHVLRGAFREAGVDMNEVSGLLDELDDQHRNGGVDIRTPVSAALLERLKQWCRRYLDEAEKRVK